MFTVCISKFAEVADFGITGVAFPTGNDIGGNIARSAAFGDC